MKRFKMLLVSFLTLALVAGCGSSGGNTPANDQAAGNTDGNQAATQPKEEDKKQDKVTIKYYTWYNGSQFEDIQKIVDNFEKENPDIHVEPIQLVDNANSTDFYKKLDIMSAADDPIDVIQFSHVDFIIERAARGVLAPIDDYLKNNNIDPANDFYVNLVYQGKVYGLQDMASPWVVIINKQALDEANLPIPEWGWTWDDFRDYAKKLNKGEGADKQFGAYFHTWGEYVGFPAYSEKPHPYLSQDQQPIFDDESYKQFFELRRAMEKEDKSVKPFSEIVGAKLHYASEFFSGKAAMVPTATFIVGMIKDQEKYPHDFQTVFAPLPRSSESVEIGSSYIGGDYLSVGSSSKHKEEAYKFIEYVALQTDVIRDFPGYKKADAGKVIQSLVGPDAALIEEESLKATVFDSRAKTVYDANWTTDYAGQMKKVIEDGFSAYMLDNLTFEAAQKQMMEDANKIISQTKK
ncbi:MAG: ABC transporter substrate-binding protein [Bacillota bacterium]